MRLSGLTNRIRPWCIAASVMLLPVPAVMTSVMAPAYAETTLSTVAAQPGTKPSPTAAYGPSSDVVSETAENGDRLYESIQYLIFKYGVDEKEARRRLALQDRAAALVDTVRSAVGDELLDVWLDQANGGVLTFLTSAPDRARSSLGGTFDSSQMAFRKSKYTARRLEAARSVIEQRLSAFPDAKVGIDRRNERIQVLYVSEPSDARAAKVREIASSAGVDIPLQVETSPPPAEGGERSCHVLDCDTPMRGGLRLHTRRDDGSWGSCTSGFNLRGSNGWVYVLTAGHCAINPGPSRQCFYHNGLPVVWEKAASGSESGCRTGTGNTRYAQDMHGFLVVDYAILPYYTDGNAWHDYWINKRDQHNLVQSQCIDPSAESCYSGTYAIDGIYTWNQMRTGWVVCAAGTGNSDVYPKKVPSGYSQGTRCGEILSKNWVGYWGGEHDLAQGIKVNICSRAGDSGGPLFGQGSHNGYGILSGGPERDGLPCDLSDPDEYSVYSPLKGDSDHPGILDSAAVTGVAMSLITTSNG